MLYFPHSIVAWGSELRLSRRITILAWDRGSASSASDFSTRQMSPQGWNHRVRVSNLLIVDGGGEHEA